LLVRRRTRELRGHTARLQSVTHVTIGLGKLRERGDVARTEDGKLLLPGQPPVWPA
jgi:hypothetical protein